MPGELELIDGLFDELWPLTRSISGPGIEASLAILGRHMPLEVTKVPTGEAVFDWIVPPEWHFRRAVLTGPDGEIICDTADSNLHVVNYSDAIDDYFDLEQLQPHLHSIPELPEAIPYVTSYYRRTWGFCLSHSKRAGLKPGRYHAAIDAEFVPGGIPFGQCRLEGSSDREILLTSYLCHPSLANNELSGPLVLLLLYRRIAAWPKRRYTYRFLLNPETIGALCFLSRHFEELREKIVAGMVLTCLGGTTDHLRYKSSRSGGSLFDLVAEKAACGALSLPTPLTTVPYSPLDGSDERQYGAPGFKLPVGQMARVVYGSYDGYHNSLDDKEFMGIANLVDSANTIDRFLQYAEVCGRPVNLQPFGEPQLGRRDLYPNMNSNETKEFSADEFVDGRERLRRILTILNLADGETDFFDIAEACGCSVDELLPVLEMLEDEKLIAFGREPVSP